uniref:Sugar phosphate transporter domain-containing protein n=1 Tax=Entomoneis paludosa TaxID=265537 RepID=A0A7S2YCI9_9STRA|mmetsp:Transcript_27296/g.57184  ORF Transcript_27296/g.57184 Transcript_27296/m.57184 type:complete len:434 (+) Transcript_27296:56-1357(+)
MSVPRSNSPTSGGPASGSTSVDAVNKPNNGANSSNGGNRAVQDAAVKTRNSASIWLIIWTCNNIGITLMNKAAFAKVDFRYPYFLSAVHMAWNALGSYMIFWSMERPRNDTDGNSKELPAIHAESCITKMLGNVQRQTLDKKGKNLILAFSVIFSLNIAIGNVSLQYVSVNFNQVMRSLVPAITIAMGFALGRPTSFQRQLAVLPVIVGVAMACFGDMSYTWLGFFYTVMCIFLAALKVVSSGEMLTGHLKLHPFDLLGHMAPLAFVQCLTMSFATGEVTSIIARWNTELSPWVDIYPMLVVMLSGVLSFTFNISSLQANKLTSPLTLCIAGNVKQVLMIGIATVIFSVEITPLNGAGIMVVLAGSGWYSYVSIMEKTETKQQKQIDDEADEENSPREDGEYVKLIPTHTRKGPRGVMRWVSAPARSAIRSSN